MLNIFLMVIRLIRIMPSTAKQAYDNGARWVVLCDTNGGTLPNEIREIVSKVVKTIPGKI